MPLQGELFGPGEELPESWDRFVAEQRLIRAWESASVGALAAAGQAPWMGMVHERGEPVALLWGRLRGTRPAMYFECKSAWVSQSGLVFGSGLEPPDRRAAIQAFERALARRLRLVCPGVLYRQLNEGEAAAVRTFGRVRVPTGYPTMVLTNQWETMNDYYLSLPRKTRHRLRAQYRQLERDDDLQVRMDAEPPDADEVSRLIKLTNHRYKRPPLHDGPPPGYFEALSGKGMIYLSYHDAKDRMLGVSVVYDTGEWMTDSLWGGLDPYDGGRSHMYFHRYLRLIEFMVEQGRAGIRMGKGMADIKGRYGAKGVPQFVVGGFR